jgi:hypothetical protein
LFHDHELVEQAAFQLWSPWAIRVLGAMDVVADRSVQRIIGGFDDDLEH